VNYRFYQGVRRVTREECYLIAIPDEWPYDQIDEPTHLCAALEECHDTPQSVSLGIEEVTDPQWFDTCEMRAGSNEAPDRFHQENMTRLLQQIANGMLH